MHKLMNILKGAIAILIFGANMSFADVKKGDHVLFIDDKNNNFEGKIKKFLPIENKVLVLVNRSNGIAIESFLEAVAIENLTLDKKYKHKIDLLRSYVKNNS